MPRPAVPAPTGCRSRRTPLRQVVVLAGLAGATALGAAASEPAATLQALTEQNRQLQLLVEQQGRELAELRRRVDALTGFTPAEASGAATAAGGGRSAGDIPEPALPETPLIISGEAGLAYLHGGEDGAYPHGEFRVDDAKLFVDARAARDVYFYSELDLSLREANDEAFHLGETYLEFAGLPRLWNGAPDSLTVRAGRLAIPFGDEYQRRGVMRNPLVTHSVADFWGVDEGVEVFGSAGRLNYVLAVQNGGHRTMHDFDGDKAVTARLTLDPARSLHLAASVMRTGDLNRAGDGLSELWIGNGFFRALGPASRTSTFGARLAQIDAVLHWPGGHLRADYGRAWFDDDDPLADNRRRLRFWQLEGRQAVTGDLYAAARYSRIDTDRGYPLVGLGNFGEYFYSGPLTKYLGRLSMGLGYRFGDNLVFKLEYAWEHGRLVDGEARDAGDQLAAQAGVAF